MKRAIILPKKKSHLPAVVKSLILFFKVEKQKAIIVSGHFNPIYKGLLEYFNNVKTIAGKLFINEIIKKYNIKTVTELGCGDANNLKLYKGFDKYYGFDVSQTVISRNNKEFDSEKISFKYSKTQLYQNVIYI